MPKKVSDADERGDQSGLEEGGLSASTSVVIRVMMRPVELALVVVQAEALQVGEDLEAQGVQDAFAGAAGHPALADLRGPLGQHHDEADPGGGPDGAEREAFHALVDAVPDEDRQRAGCPGRRRPAAGG